ncbi:siderophore transport protein [Paenibacillus pini JCM 16418]|uniref:MFS-type drug efflux transporter P55 n=1 Tax=Paenibacillus pini JCM 16418 TaxID=1236976 RepID=W7YGH9_9BACL|nr:siderophore transport protein [Paenibacillus pini JCM 16418]
MHGVRKGLVLAIPLAVLCLFSFIAGKVIGKSKQRMKWTGFAGMALATICMIITGFSNQIFFVVTFFSLCGAGIGTALPCMDALITEGIEKEQRGTITSLYSSMRFIGVSLGPPVVSLLLKSNHWVLFGMMALVGAIGGFVTLWAVRPQENKNKTDDKNSSKPLSGLMMKRAKAR